MVSKKAEVEAKETKKEVKVDLDGIKKELTDYVDEKIRNELVENIENANKRVIREKNIKIIWRDFLVLILLGICGFLVYTLYNINYLDLDIVKNKSNEKTNNVVEDNTNKEEVVVEPTLDELKAKYSYLLDNYVIGEDSSYLEDFYNGNLTGELKNYFVLNNLDFSTLTLQDNYNIINEFSFAEKYKELFNSEYENKNFNYNGNEIRYISIINSYLSTSILEKTNGSLQREISDIKVNDNIVNITTVEGIIKDNKIINPLTKEEVSLYNNGLINNEEKLVKITYIFNNGKLESISK